MGRTLSALVWIAIAALGAAGEIHGRDAAQILGALAQHMRIGAGPGDQVDLQPDLGERMLGAQRAERVGGGKRDLELAAATSGSSIKPLSQASR